MKKLKNLKKKMDGVKEKHKKKIQKLKGKHDGRLKSDLEKFKAKDKIEKKLKGSPISKSYPLEKAIDFIERTLSKNSESEKVQLYDPFKKGIEFKKENFDKICFHFTIAKPMESVSVKNITTFYHWLNVYVFLDGDIIMSELDWEVQKEENGDKWQRIEENIEEKKYPAYFNYLDEKEAVLVQDIDDKESYPPESAYLVVEKEELKEIIPKNPLVGEAYDFTGSAHCQAWVKGENEMLGLGSKFSCDFVNDFFGKTEVTKAVGNVIKKMVISRMDNESEEEGEGGDDGAPKKKSNFVQRLKAMRKKLND